MPLPLYLACFLLLLLPATVKGATVPRSLLQSSPSNHVYYLKTPWPTTAYLIDARLSCASCGIRGGFDDVDADPGDKSGFARYLAKKRFMVQSSNCPKTLNGVRSSLFESRINFPGADQSRWLRGGKGDIQSVVFQVHCNSTTMDEDVGLIGENEALGSWNAAVRMRADKWPLWTVDVPICQTEMGMQYKYVKIQKDGTISKWEECDNRRVSFAGINACVRAEALHDVIEINDGDFHLEPAAETMMDHAEDPKLTHVTAAN